MSRVFSRPPARAQQLATDIEQDIVDRHLQSGDRIATMDELRERSGYGRATIGETARLLAERGTVEIRPGRGGGLFVASLTPMVRLRRTLLAVPQGASSVSDAIAVRESLEELVDLDAARHCTMSDAAELALLIAEMREIQDDWSVFMASNWALHERIAAITPNELARGVYVGTIRCVAELAVRPQPEGVKEADYLKHRVDIHARLVAAITSNDLEQTSAAVAAHRGITIGANTAEDHASA